MPKRISRGHQFAKSRTFNFLSIVLLKQLARHFYQISLLMRFLEWPCLVGVAQRWLLLSQKDPLKERFPEHGIKPKSKNLIFHWAEHPKMNHCANCYQIQAWNFFKKQILCFFLLEVPPRPLYPEN